MRKIKEKRDMDTIKKSMEVIDCEEFIIKNLIVPTQNKLCNINEYEKETNLFPERTLAAITRIITLTKKGYELFTKYLLHDFEELESFGGSRTDDERVASLSDYEQLPEEERQTIKWYPCNCVAIYCDDDLKFVIDPQGYSYARYVYLADIITKDDTYIQCHSI